MPCGPFTNSLLIRSSASFSLPSKISPRTSVRYCNEVRLLLSCGPPLQNVSSFNCISSVSVPPKTIAPMRELPSGKASSQHDAGESYQRRSFTRFQSSPLLLPYAAINADSIRKAINESKSFFILNVLVLGLLCKVNGLAHPSLFIMYLIF